MQTILIVEDDPFHRSLLDGGLCDYYSKNGDPEVLAVPSAEAAMKILECRPVSVIIADMHLEDEDAGFRLIRLAKQRHPRTQIVVTTAHATIDLVVRWVRAGALEVVPKPFTFDTIWAAVKRALQLASTNQDREALVERLIVEEWDLVSKARTSSDQGSALESLCSLLFGTVPGWTRIESRLVLPSEELDLVVANESSDVFWRQYGTLILIECKNWHRKRRPGRTDFDAFLMKLQRRAPSDCRLGFFVSSSGLATTFLAEVRRIARDPQVVVPLDFAALWNLVLAEDRSDELKKHVRNAVMGRP